PSLLPRFCVPCSSFTRNMTSTTLGPPVGFDNFGDGSLSNFGLYEFGGLIPGGGGLLKLEMEYMELRLPAAGLAGDFNNDGKVDAGDYATWRKNSANASLPNDNGLTTHVARYNLWRSTFGTPGSGSGLSGSAVPEPGTIGLAVVGMFSVLAGRRRRNG